MSTEYENYLRPILDRMPVKPERVSAVNGPLMNVTRIDDKTLDVKMTTSFRAHFGNRYRVLVDARWRFQRAKAMGRKSLRSETADGPIKTRAVCRFRSWTRETSCRDAGGGIRS